MLPDSSPLFASRRARSGLLDTFPWQKWKFKRNLFKFNLNPNYYAVDNSSWHTISYEEVSSYSVHNSYITDLYRPALSSTQCLLSILRVHNESVNIWTAVLGFIWFCFVLPYDLLISLPGVLGSHSYSAYLTHAAFASTSGKWLNK